MLLLSLAVAAPIFVDTPSAVPSPQLCADSREGCYSNYTALADLDGDGDLDAIFANGGGYYVAGDAAPLSAWRNDGGVFVEVGEEWFGGFVGRVRQVAVGDIDRDGDLDVVVPDSWAMQPDALFVDGVDEGPERLGTSSRAAAARLGDVDGDLDLDLFLSDWGADPFTDVGVGHLYLNDGDGYFAESVGGIPSDLSTVGTGPIDADFADLDDDHDLDLLIASRDGDSFLLMNDGGTFTLAELPAQKGPYVYGPEACDVDGDDDLDLWLDNAANRQLEEMLLINDGGVFTDETAKRVTDNPGADDNEVQCADVDGDGDFDAVIASLSGEERVLLNDGAGFFTLAEEAFTPLGDATLGLDLGDIDGDGILDAVTAQGETGESWLNRFYLGAAAVDTQRPTVRWEEYREGGMLLAISDNATTDVGPRVTVETERDGVVSTGWFLGGDLFWVPLPDGDCSSWTRSITDAAGNNSSMSVSDICDEDPPKSEEPACGCSSSRTPGTIGLASLAALLMRRRTSPSRG